MNKILQVWDTIYKNSPLLAWTGSLNFILVPVFICLSQWDARQLLEVSNWYKPIKFAFSLAIFSWTIAVLLDYYPFSWKTRKKIGRWIAIVAYIEIVVITLQAARGEASHFNISTPTNRLLFYVMGLAIFINFIVLVKLLIDTYLLPFNGSSEIKLGIRLGLTAIILGSVIGGVMSWRLQHSVGVSDNSIGLPFLGWNSQGGDLRVAHFLGIHGLQILPIMAFIIQKLKGDQAKYWVILVGWLYLALIVATFLQAWMGYPLV